MDVTLHQLRCFVAVAASLHFARAAEGMRISPSTLSEQISTLERTLGRRLFERSSRAVLLTGPGSELLPLARDAVAAADEVLRWGRGSEQASVAVGVMASSPRIRLILSAAATEMPEVEWGVRPVGFTGGISALRSGEVSCAFLFGMPGTAPPEGMRAFELWSERLLVALPSDHRLAGRERIGTEELRGETLIAPARPRSKTDESWGDWYGAIDPELPRHCRISSVVTSVDETVELVAAGMGLNVLGDSAVTLYARPGVVFVPLDTETRVRSVLLARDEPAEPAVTRFVGIACRTADIGGAAGRAGTEASA